MLAFVEVRPKSTLRIDWEMSWGLEGEDLPAIGFDRLIARWFMNRGYR